MADEAHIPIELLKDKAVFDIQHIGGILGKCYAYYILIYECLADFHGISIDTRQGLESKFRFAYYSSKSHGYRQANHPCPRDAYTHCIFYDVAAQVAVDGLDFVIADAG